MKNCAECGWALTVDEAKAGEGGTATVGLRGKATAGAWGKATAGAWGTATAGLRGTATAGYGGKATAGACGKATAGACGTATAGEGGTATAGECGMVQVKWWDEKALRYRIANGYVGESGILPGRQYVVVDGKLNESISPAFDGRGK